MNRPDMYKFLSQFKLLEGFSVEHRHLENPELFQEAKDLGFVKNWIPKTKCTYYATAICTLQGRLFIKRMKTLHPGHFIREELKAREWSQVDLAWICGCTVQSVNLLVKGKKGISPRMAKALGAAFAVSPEFIINLQMIYDLSRAKEPSIEIEKRAGNIN